MKKIPLTLFLLAFSCLPSWSAESKNWVIDPISNVAGITPKSSRDDVIRLFGPKHVEGYDVLVGEGETVLGTRIYGGTEKEILIEWKKDGTPERLTIEQPGAQWKTFHGISIGASLEQVEKENGGPFKISGFDWDYPGRTVSWEGGKLPSQLQLDFEHSDSLPQAVLRELPLGDKEFSTALPIMKKLGLKVRRMFIRW